MSDQDGTKALELARRLMTSALSPNSTSTSRRTFYEQLISLPFYPSYECKAFFGTLVAKFFAEFEDLQDGAIDALLDLCEDEDEKVRIVGIKGLGPTGKAEPKWVRGNTGVLLQLLACQPRELKYVRESLNTLISVSPEEVLNVMSDDCKGSEEETGASRRNILDFLYQSKEMRSELLESGNNVRAERVFREGFLHIIPMVSENDRLQILEMVFGLSTISGKNGNDSTRRSFWKALVESDSREGSTDSTLPILRSFMEYLDKFNSNSVDPRYPLLFVASHGTAIVELAVQRQEKIGKTFLDRLENWIEASISRWNSRDGGGDRDLSIEMVVPKFVGSLLPALLKQSDRLYRDDKLPQSALPLERLTYAIFRLTLFRDQRSIISSKDADDLLDLCSDVDKAERRTTKGSIESIALKNIADMAEILGDPKRTFRKVVPTWRSTRPTDRITPTVPFASSSKPLSRPQAPTRPITPPHAPRGPRNDASKPPIEPRKAPIASSSRIPTGPSSRQPPTRPRTPPTRPRTPPPAPSALRQSPPIARPATPPLPPPPAPESKAPVRPPTPPLPSPRVEAKMSSVVEKKPSIPKPISRDTNPPQSDDAKVDLPAPSLSSRLGMSSTDSQPQTGLSIRNTARSTSNVPDKPSPPTTLPPKSEISIKSQQPPPQETKRTPSLAERLGISPAPSISSSTPPSNKRIRENDSNISSDGSPIPRSNGNGTTTTHSNERPSLLSRLAGRDEPSPKRPKEGSTSKLSLRDRINGTTPTSTPPAHAAMEETITPVNENGQSTTKGFTILNHSETTQASKGLSILARASPTSTSLPRPGYDASPLAQGLSIRNSSALPKAPTAPAVLATDGEEVVVRKGRGFRAPSPERDIVMAEPSEGPTYQQIQGQAQRGMPFGIRGLRRPMYVRGGRGMRGA